MRFFRACACGIGVLIGAAALTAALTAVRCLQNPYACLQRAGEKIGQEYYLYSASSQAMICTELSLSDVYSVTGEKAVFRFETEESAREGARKLLEEHRADIVATECVAGVQSVYAYSARLGEGVRLFGERVNLQIVLSGATVQVGLPIVFGGY